MTLKELSKVLRGVNKFKLQARVNSNIETLDEVLIYEIQYLPASLLRRNILEIDLEENIIFLDKDYNQEEAVKTYITVSEIPDEFLDLGVFNKLEDSNLI